MDEKRKPNVGDWVKVIEDNGGLPKYWNPDGYMNYLHNTWRKVHSLDSDEDKVHIENGSWYILHDQYTEVRTPDEMLEYARKQYPIGTEYVPLQRDNYTVVEQTTCYHEPKWLSNGLYIYSNSASAAGYIFADGKWAEVVTENKTKKSEEFLTELGDTWYSLVGYKIKSKGGAVSTIITHYENGHVRDEHGAHHDIHNVLKPYRMVDKSTRVYAQPPTGVPVTMVTQADVDYGIDGVSTVARPEDWGIVLIKPKEQEEIKLLEVKQINKYKYGN